MVAGHGGASGVCSRSLMVTDPGKRAGIAAALSLCLRVFRDQVTMGPA